MIQRNSFLFDSKNDLNAMDTASLTTSLAPSLSTSNLNSSSNDNTSKLRQLNSFLKEEINQIRSAYSSETDYHNKNEIRTEKSLETKSVIIERQGGLANRFVLFLLVIWYFFSALTLYTNKYIVTSQKIDPTIIGTVQMIITCLCGFFQLKSQWKHKYLI